MAIQTSNLISDRIIKHGYLFDSALEQSIKNLPHTLQGIEQTSDKDYYDICFCPSNFKLYATLNDGTTSYGRVNVFSPYSNSDTVSPETITVNGDPRAIVYCPSVDKIFISTNGKIQIIDPASNTIIGNIPITSDIYNMVYLPHINKIFAQGEVEAGNPESGLRMITPGEMKNNKLSGFKIEDYYNVPGLLPGKAAMCAHPTLNRIFIGSGYGIWSIAPKIDFSKEPVAVLPPDTLSLTIANPNAFVAYDIVYCPFNEKIYYLYGTDADSYIYVISPKDSFSIEKTITVSSRTLTKILYCQSNNMLYCFGDTKYRTIGLNGDLGDSGGDETEVVMIDPTGDYLYQKHYDPNLEIPNNAVCDVPINGRIYGVGKAEIVKYIETTNSPLTVFTAPEAEPSSSCNSCDVYHGAGQYYVDIGFYWNLCECDDGYNGQQVNIHRLYVDAAEVAGYDDCDDFLDATGGDSDDYGLVNSFFKQGGICTHTVVLSTMYSFPAGDGTYTFMLSYAPQYGGSFDRDELLSKCCLKTIYMDYSP